MLSWQPAERAVGRMVVRQQGRHAVCSADAALCSREVPRWCRLSGVSQEAITFQSRKTSSPGSGKQNHSLQNLSFAKGSVAAGLFLFLRSQRTPNLIL